MGPAAAPRAFIPHFPSIPTICLNKRMMHFRAYCLWFFLYTSIEDPAHLFWLPQSKGLPSKCLFMKTE